MFYYKQKGKKLKVSSKSSDKWEQFIVFFFSNFCLIFSETLEPFLPSGMSCYDPEWEISTVLQIIFS
jgi:hypothetical protein